MDVEALPQLDLEHQAEVEQERVRHFQGVLAEVTDIKTVDIPLDLHTPTPISDAEQHFSWAEYTDGTSVYLHEDYQGAASTSEVTFVPRQSRSGRRSAHGVFFGDLIFGDGGVVPVAVKPHETDVDTSCITDYLTNIAARQLGLDTLQPVGMVMGHDTKINYSMTRLDTIDTLDSIDWETIINTDPKDEDMLAIWDQVARQTAMLHSMGSIDHGDLAARNIGVRLDGGVFLLDWEHANFSTIPPRDAEASYVHSRKDVGELMESMVRPRTHPYKAGIGLLSNHPNPWEGFRELVFDDYAATRLGFAETHNNVAEVQEELHELERSLQDYLALLLLDTPHYVNA